MADTLSLLFELNADGRQAVAEFQRVRKVFAAEIAATKKLVSQTVLRFPSVAGPTTRTGVRGAQADAQVRDFKRIEAEAKKSSAAQEREQRRLNAAVQSLQRQRSAALIKGFRDEERAAVASARAQERTARQAARSIQQAFRGIGPGLQSLGRTLTIGVTAPLLALGAASLKSAKDLDANVNTLKAFTGSAEAAERRLAQLIATSRQTPGLTTNLALTLDSFLRTAQVTEQAIDRVLPAVGRLNAVSRLGDPQRFAQNLVQLVTQNFERPDLKELVGASPLAGQLITEIFNVDSPINSAAIKEQAKKLGLTTVDAFFNAFAEAAERNQGLATVTESIGTRFDKIVDRVTVALRPLGLAIINAIQPFVEPVARLIERLGAAFDSLSGPIKTAIIVIAGIAAAAGPVLFVLGGLATAITSIVSAVTAVVAVIGTIGFPAIAAAVIGITALIGEWVVILGALGLAWKTNFLNIRELVTDAAAAILDAFNRIRAVIDEASQRILPTLQSITQKVLGVITALWQRFGGTIVSVVRTSFGLAIRGIEAFLRFFGNVIDLVAKLIDNDWRGAWRAFSRIIINALDSIDEFFKRALPALARGFLTLNAFLIRQAVTLAQTATTLATRFITSMATAFIAGAPLVSDALAKMLLIAVAGVAVGPIGAALVAGVIAEMRKAAAEGVAIPIATVAQDNLQRIRLNPDGTVKTDGRPKPATDSTGGKGADAETRHRIRLLELEAERAEAIAQQRIAAENHHFDQRRTSLRDFTNFQIKEEEAVLEKKKAVFAAERAEAEKLGKGRDLALGEIRLRELKAELDFAGKRNQLLANQEREEQEAARAHRQALLDIQDEADRLQLEKIDSYVERYLISFEEAEKRRLKIEDDARERRRAELETQLLEAGDNIEEQQRVNDALDKLKAESATATEEAESRKRAALRATLEAEQEYYDTLARLTLQTKDLLLEAAGIQLGRLQRVFGDRRVLRLRALQIERQANEDEHQERLRQIEQDKQDAIKQLEGVRDAEEKLLALRRKYAALEKAEIARRNQERRDEEDRERRERDPFTSIKDQFAQFQIAAQNANSAIAESLTSLSEQVVASFGSMVDATRSAIGAWILYGESIGKALKKALAEQLATLAVEFAIQSLKHAAYALGSLAFGNFAGAAKHAAAAAAFAAAAAATGFAARSLAKSAGLFNRNQGAGAASAAVGGGEPRNRTFNDQGPVESSSRAAQEGSGGGFFGGVIARIEQLQKQNLEVQRQQQLQIAQLAETQTRMRAAKPGDVVTMGASDARQAIGIAVIDNSNSDGEFNERLQRNLGFA